MATPTLMEFMSALLTIERFLKAKGEELKERFPEQAADIDRVLAYLNVQERTLTTLTAVWQELQVVATGSGPVCHDPVDFA